MARSTRERRASVSLIAGAGLLTSLLWAGPQAIPVGAATKSGALRVHSGNPRYLTDDSGRVIVLTGSHTWSVFQDLEHLGQAHSRRYDSYRNWLSLLERWNHNFTRGWIWEDEYYSPLPYRKVGKRWRLDQGNPRFIERLTSRVRKAESKGIYTSVMLFQGWSVSDKGAPGRPRRRPDPLPVHPFSASRNRNRVAADSDGDGQGLELHETTGPILDYQKSHVARLVEAMRPFENIIWEIANEAHSGSLAWQTDMVRFIHQLENGQKNRHLVWMSCFGGGNAAENKELLSGPAEIISPCNGPDSLYLDNPPHSTTTKIVIADSDHIAPGRVRTNWVWKSFLRGLHPIYMDLEADTLPWYQGTELNGDPRIADQMRRALGAVQVLAARMPLEAMIPQGSSEGSPIKHLGGSPPFALFSTDNPAMDSSGFDGAELLALEPSGGKTLEVCGLTPGGDYIARWLRPIDATGFGRPIHFRVPAADQAPGKGSSKHCRRLVNPDSGSGKLLHLRRTAALE